VDGQGAEGVRGTGLYQVSDFRQNAEKGGVQVTSSGFVCAVRRGHGQAPHLLIGGGAAQAARNEPLHADRFTEICHYYTVRAITVAVVCFG
jgi:hypothetical protein